MQIFATNKKGEMSDVKQKTVIENCKQVFEVARKGWPTTY